MREILFRGKTPDGRWVCGDLVKDPCQICGEKYTEYLIRGYDEFDVDGNEFFELVTPKTVGQYIGLKDKNGKIIFDGDILRSVHFESIDGTNYLYHIVEWSDRLSGWHMKNAHSKTKDGHAQAWVYFKNATMPEIIGNIHDNPGLFK